MQRVLTAWAPHTPCRDLPSILAARLRSAGMQPLRQRAIPILNTSYNPATISYWVAQVIRPFVAGRQTIGDQEAAEWLEEFAKLEQRGAYFFLKTPVLSEAVKGGLKRRITVFGDPPTARQQQLPIRAAIATVQLGSMQSAMRSIRFKIAPGYV